MPAQTKTKIDKVKAWMERHNIAGDEPWFDKQTTYYNLTIKQIIAVASYLKRKN